MSRILEWGGPLVSSRRQTSVAMYVPTRPEQLQRRDQDERAASLAAQALNGHAIGR